MTKIIYIILFIICIMLLIGLVTIQFIERPEFAKHRDPYYILNCNGEIYNSTNKTQIQVLERACREGKLFFGIVVNGTGYNIGPRFNEDLIKLNNISLSLN